MTGSVSGLLCVACSVLLVVGGLLAVGDRLAVWGLLSIGGLLAMAETLAIKGLLRWRWLRKLQHQPSTHCRHHVRAHKSSTE